MYLALSSLTIISPSRQLVGIWALDMVSYLKIWNGRELNDPKITTLFIVDRLAIKFIISTDLTKRDIISKPSLKAIATKRSALVGKLINFGF